MISWTKRVATPALIALVVVAAGMMARSPLWAQDTPDRAPRPIFMPIVVNQPPVPVDFGDDPVEGSNDGNPAIDAPDFIFADGFEAGNLALWSNVLTDGGDLAVTPFARIQGAAGLQMVVDDGDPLSAVDMRAVAEHRLRVRLYVDPNSIGMADGNSLLFFTGHSRGDARLTQIELLFTGGSYALRAGVTNDANQVVYTQSIAVSDAPHAVEIDWQKSADRNTKNGSLRLWVDGSSAGVVNNIDNNWRTIERTRIGAVTAPPAGVRGTFFLDSYEVRRSSYIGLWSETQPVATATLPPAATPTSGPAATGTPVPGPTNTPPHVVANPAIVFVQRQIPDNGSIYWDAVKDMPGVGAHSRFRVAAPGKLLVREANGSLRTLVDGANPTAASLNLIDVNAPDVSYDGTTIVFAGLPNGSYGRGPANNPGAWRLYSIRVDGTSLRQLTFSDQNLSYTQFGAGASALQAYDDTDPAWLPDGRIVLSSTRWPSKAQYSGVRSSNLYVVNADGTSLHRITAERNGADRPMVDPLTGKIVYARWWRNHRFATNQMDTVTSSSGGFLRKDGLTMDRNNHVGGPDFLFRNMWHAAVINPDGTNLVQWGGTHHHDDANHMYGGAFLPNGSLVANYFPMQNMTEAAGFGGLRLYQRGPGTYTPVLGITTLSPNMVHPANPTSYGIFVGTYASEPAALPNGNLVVSWARDTGQDYGLYTVKVDGTGLTLLYDNPGTTELRAKPIMARPLPPILHDTVNTTASLLPPQANGPYNIDGVFTFDALNVYANGPVDTQISDAPAVGSAATIRFFTDFQRTNVGLDPDKDWPILLGEMPVNANGSVKNMLVPANIPVFEQIRSSDGTVPFSPGFNGSAAHVAGMNFGKPGEVQRCVGCHTGHTMIPLPANNEDALFSNVAPGAVVRVSSTSNSDNLSGINDRRVLTGEIYRYWTSSPGQTSGQWIQLTFPVPITVRKVVLYNPRSGDEANSSVQVQATSVRLFADAAGTQQVSLQATGPLSTSGTAIAFSDVRARVVRVDINSVIGTFYGANLASIAEIEVIARAETP